MGKKQGISLIVLVITIIVIIIIAGAIILNLSENNPIESANKATFLSDLSGFKEQLELYKGEKYLDTAGDYDSSKLQADNSSVTYGEDVDSNKNIGDVIPSLKDNTKYAGQFKIVDGKLIYQGSNTKRQRWASENGVEVIIIGEPTVTIVNPSKNVVAQGTDVKYIVKFTSNAALTTIDLTGKVELVTDEEESVTPQPEIIVGSISGTSSDVTREVEITIKTNSLSNGGYKLKLKTGVVINSDGMSNVSDKISLIGFDVDNEVPINPEMLANPADWTNENVVVTITYSSDSYKKEYSFDSTTWQTYTGSITVSENNTTVFAKGTDEAGNESGQSTIIISNIDKTVPMVVYGTNGENNPTQVSTTVIVNDSGSGLNTSTLQYVWDTQNTTIPSSGWTTFINESTLTKTGDGSYYLWIKVNDNVGNNVTTVSNKFTVGELADIVSTVQSVNKTFSGATSGYSYNNPVIPTGFVAVTTTDANWNNLSTDFDKGLVIQDVSGNQFVWVPINGTNVTYAKWCTTNISYSSTSEDTIPSGFSTTSITTTYKGFYIARYESAFDYNNGSIRVASKKSINKTASNWSTTRNATYNGYLWNFINYTDSKTYAENMDTSYGYNTSLVGTNLITGAQWDTALKWIQNSGKSVTDSRTWGNHLDSISPANVSGYASLQISGYSNNWKAKNIYDLAGNIWEWTNEIYSSNHVHRGGGYGNSGATDSIACRYGYGGDTLMGNYIGFRVGLYIL